MPVTLLPSIWVSTSGKVVAAKLGERQQNNNKLVIVLRTIRCMEESPDDFLNISLIK
jgi:hypothetical protein